jgi:hypothetical protein
MQEHKKKERSLYTLTRRRRLEKIYRENPPPFLFAICAARREEKVKNNPH